MLFLAPNQQCQSTEGTAIAAAIKQRQNIHEELQISYSKNKKNNMHHTLLYTHWLVVKPATFAIVPSDKSGTLTVYIQTGIYCL